MGKLREELVADILVGEAMDVLMKALENTDCLARANQALSERADELWRQAEARRRARGGPDGARGE